jgi:hypothetical protein
MNFDGGGNDPFREVLMTRRVREHAAIQSNLPAAKNAATWRRTTANVAESAIQTARTPGNF